MMAVRLHGVLFAPEAQITQQKFDDLTANFTTRPGDVIIVSYPKSGTTWTRQIVKLIQGDGIDTGHVWSNNPWLERLNQGSDFNMEQRPPLACFTHLPYHIIPGGEPTKSPAKYIHVTRNPRDVAVSLYYHISRHNWYEFEGDWNCFFELFMKGEVVYNSWFDHTLEWWKHKGADNILFLKYEDMHKDLRGSVERIAQFIDHQIDDNIIDSIAEQCTFDSMKANRLANPDELILKSKEKYADTFYKPNSAPFLRKGVIGDWMNHFSDEQSRRFDEEYSKRMIGSELELTYN